MDNNNTSKHCFFSHIWTIYLFPSTTYYYLLFTDISKNSISFKCKHTRTIFYTFGHPLTHSYSPTQTLEPTPAPANALNTNTLSFIQHTEFLWSTTFSFCSLKLGKRASGFIAFSVAWSLFLSSFLSLRLFLCLPVWQDLYFATRVSISNPISILHSGLIWYPFEVHFTFRFGKPKNENNFSLFVLAAPSQDVFLPTTQHYTIGLGGSILLLH